MSDQPRKGRRLGAPPTPSTVDDTTPPTAPTQPTPTEASGGTLAVVPDAAAPASPPHDPPPPEHGPVRAFGYLPQPTLAGATAPDARDVLRPMEREETEQISVRVPAVLNLRRRSRQYAAFNDVEQRVQIALALDEWLRARGF
ncbi:hypothetical protein [Actinomadura flavalba]|uniref:hypothetical protein n=1 Tax=Actinomadura flavalba TaxID=1120938 RepID=UPI000361E923|nr:hypothetical protein [Actinomadura flavalba]